MLSIIENGSEMKAPEPTEDLDRALADLDQFGLCAIRNAMSPELLDAVREATYRVARTERKYGWTQHMQYGQDDKINQRIWNLPSRDPVFCEVAEHPTVIALLKRTLGWPASLSSMSANILNGGGESMMAHTDQGYLPGKLDRAWVYNFAWCVDEFTAENGATLVAPGSHRWEGGLPDGAVERMVPAIAPAGALVVLDGRLWHTNGRNSNGVTRAGLFTTYSLPWLLPQENWSLSLDPILKQTASETLQTLFGLRPGVLGRINGRDRL